MKLVFLCLYAWVAIQSLLVSIGYVVGKRNVLKRFLFLIFLFSSIIAVVHYAYRFTDFFTTAPEFAFIHDILDLLFGPLVYMLSCYVYEERVNKSLFAHFAPALAYALYFVGVKLVMAPVFDLASYVASSEHTTLVYFILFSFFFYTFATFRKIKQIKQRGMAISFLSGAWLNIFFIFLLIKSMHLLVLFFFKVYYNELWFSNTALRNWVDLLFFLSTTLLLIAQENTLFFRRFFRFKSSDTNQFEGLGQLTENNYLAISSAIDETDIRKCAEALYPLFYKGKVFVDTELDQKKLAGRISMPSRHITRLLNFYLNTNFTEFVNYFRVNEAKRILIETNGQKSKMLTVSIDSGFKSESAFYANFRRFTGMTPKKYRQKA